MEAVRPQSVPDGTCVFAWSAFLFALFLSVFAPLLCPLHEWPNPALLSQLGRGQPTRTTFSAVVKGLAKPL
jgi:hypothetical protein